VRRQTVVDVINLHAVELQGYMSMSCPSTLQFTHRYTQHSLRVNTRNMQLASDVYNIDHVE